MIKEEMRAFISYKKKIIQVHVHVFSILLENDLEVYGFISIIFSNSTHQM